MHWFESGWAIKGFAELTLQWDCGLIDYSMHEVLSLLRKKKKYFKKFVAKKSVICFFS